MIPIKSYSNLNKVINFYLHELKINDKGYSTSTLKFLKDDMPKVIMSLIWLNKKIQDVTQFQSNRYFLDALNINALPSPNMLNNFSNDNQLKNLLSLPKDSINYENLKKIGLDIGTMGS